MSAQKLSEMSVKEIKRKIHNLNVRKWKLNKQQTDPNWDEKERIRKRAVYKKYSKKRIQTQIKWNKKNRVKTRKYNKKHYDSHRKQILKNNNAYYAKNKKKILAARRKKK